MTREIPIEVTREVPVTQMMEVTREIPVTVEIIQTAEASLPITQVVEVTREVPVTVEIIQTVETSLPITQVVEVTREIPVTVEVIREVTRIVEAGSESDTPSSEDGQESEVPLDLVDTPFFFDFDSYSVGDIPPAEVGIDLVIREDGEKYISGLSSNGLIDINDISNSGEFNVVVEINQNDPQTTEISLKFSDGSSADIVFLARSPNAYARVQFGQRVARLSSTAWSSGTNTLRIEVDTESGTAKLFIANEFFETIQINTGIEMNGIKVTNLGLEDRIFELSVRQ